MTGLHGRVVVVTGAAGSIGGATSERLLAAGATVVDADQRPSDRPGAGFVELDVLDAASVSAAFDAVVADHGRIDGLVAAAGVAEQTTPAEEMSPAVFDRTLGVNLRGLFLCCQAAGRRMLQQGAGSIVTVASMSGNHVVNVPQRQAAYNASKAAVVALTRSLAYEWAPRGVRVNAVSPGYVDTPMLANRPELQGGWRAATPLGRFARPEEVAAAVVWLLGDESTYCIGTELLMDGGYSLP